MEVRASGQPGPSLPPRRRPRSHVFRDKTNLHVVWVAARRPQPAPRGSRPASPPASRLKGPVSPRLSTPGGPAEGVPPGAQRELAREAEVTYPAHPAWPRPGKRHGAGPRPRILPAPHGSHVTPERGGHRPEAGALRPDRTHVGLVGHVSGAATDSACGTDAARAPAKPHSNR